MNDTTGTDLAVSSTSGIDFNLYGRLFHRTFAWLHNVDVATHLTAAIWRMNADSL